MAYNQEAYRALLATLKTNIQEMDNAMDGVFFEHGPNGISDRAETYLNEVDESLRDAWDSLASVRAYVEKHGSKE